MPAPREILTRDVKTGSAVAFDEHAVELCSSSAPWRDLVRLERSRKALAETELTSLWPLVVVVRGNAGRLVQRVNGEPLQALALRAGHVFFYPQGASISIRMEPVDATHLQLAPSLLRAAAQDARVPPRLAPAWRERDERVDGLATLLELELRSACVGGSLFGEHLAYALAAYMVETYSGPREGGARVRLCNRKLSDALQYIEANAMRDLSLRELADAAHLSPFHFARMFKQSTGLTPYRYVLQWRIEEAKRLLRHTRLDLAEIGQRLGFRDQSHFTARFRRTTGVTPRRWRQSS